MILSASKKSLKRNRVRWCH